VHNLLGFYGDYLVKYIRSRNKRPLHFHQVLLHGHELLPLPQQQNNEQSHLNHHSKMIVLLIVREFKN